MEVPVQMILDKIGEELSKANQSNDEGRFREHIASIHSLCDVVLSSNSIEGNRKKTIPEIQQMSTKQHKKVNVEEANGDSLLDF
ncbi:YwdI family protein [Cytobacillus sp. IB215665]|uniref:YwdI family protein n=1 Tax=Cytobacillus sp. IB215665 TaxID=3097357 RepID=UPI002A148C7C|nr:YwdI family protein [Cytobacillus sp. IB215665]MDX8363638.1 YwdI family protein [Cytobacillus sp. IB215665]